MTDLFTLEGRLALVTGSSRGLGRSLARALARAGARVIVHGRNPEIVEDARDEMSRIAGQPRGSGKIVNIGSVQSVLARQTIAPYSASKAGIAGLTRGMAADLARHGIQVNTLSPGYFATEMNRDLVDDDAFTAWLETRTPAGRWGDFSELDGPLLFLASDASSFVSGQNLVVDGGMTSVV